MRITVKQLDINRGEQGDPWSCPVARAARRAFDYPAQGSAREVWTDGTNMGVGNDSVPLPEAAKAFINTFDNLGADAVEPFSFIIRRPA